MFVWRLRIARHYFSRLFHHVQWVSTLAHFRSCCNCCNSHDLRDFLVHRVSCTLTIPTKKNKLTFHRLKIRKCEYLLPSICCCVKGPKLQKPLKVSLIIDRFSESLLLPFTHHWPILRALLLPFPHPTNWLEQYLDLNCDRWSHFSTRTAPHPRLGF